MRRPSSWDKARHGPALSWVAPVVAMPEEFCPIATISRVHLLIIEIAGNLFAIDTASYNGVWDDKEQERATPFEAEHILSLGEVAKVTWRSFR